MSISNNSKLNKKVINNALQDHFDLIKKIDDNLKNEIILISDSMIQVLKKEGTIFWCGNGGSSSDSQHLSAELIGRLKIKDSPPYKSLALSADSTVLTCLSNDYSYEHIFERQIMALGSEKDMLVGMTTSGKSKNVINALESAFKKGLRTVAFLGEHTIEVEHFANHFISIKSNNTARIQETHMLIGHIICEIVEEKLSKL